jgi:hypothetical protein
VPLTSSSTAARRAAAELLGTGNLTALDGALDFSEFDALFRY